MPALFTTISTPPNAEIAVSTMREAESHSATESNGGHSSATGCLDQMGCLLAGAEERPPPAVAHRESLRQSGRPPFAMARR